MEATWRSEMEASQSRWWERTTAKSLMWSLSARGCDKRYNINSQSLWSEITAPYTWHNVIIVSLRVFETHLSCPLRGRASLRNGSSKANYWLNPSWRTDLDSPTETTFWQATLSHSDGTVEAQFSYNIVTSSYPYVFNLKQARGNSMSVKSSKKLDTGLTAWSKVKTASSST